MMDAYAIDAVVKVAVKTVVFALASAEGHTLHHDGGDAGDQANHSRIPTVYNPIMNLSKSSFNWLTQDKHIEFNCSS